MANFYIGKPTVFNLAGQNFSSYFSQNNYSGGTISSSSNWSRKFSWNGKSYSMSFTLKARQKITFKIQVTASGWNECYADIGDFSFSLRASNKSESIGSANSTMIDGYNYDTYSLTYNDTHEITLEANDTLTGTIYTPITDMGGGYSLSYNINSILLNSGHWTGNTYNLPTIPNFIYIGNNNNQPVQAKKIYIGDDNNKPIQIWP